MVRPSGPIHSSFPSFNSACPVSQSAVLYRLGVSTQSGRRAVRSLPAGCEVWTQQPTRGNGVFTVLLIALSEHQVFSILTNEVFCSVSSVVSLIRLQAVTDSDNVLAGMFFHFVWLVVDGLHQLGEGRLAQSLICSVALLLPAVCHSLSSQSDSTLRHGWTHSL